MSFGFSSIGHFFSSFFHDIHVGATAVNNVIAKVNTPGNQATVEGVTALINPAAANAERIAFGLLGTASAAVTAVDAADLSKGVNVQLDASAAQEIQQLISQSGASTAAIAAGFKS